MNKRQAKELGIESGYESGMYGDFTPEELADEDAFMQAGAEILENKRQYADDPTYEIAQEPNADSLFDAYEEGESIGLLRAWKKRQRPNPRRRSRRRSY